jgi:hypothetical protein
MPGRQMSLLDEAARMPDAAISFARGTSWVKTPEEFVPLRETVRTNHRTEFAALTAALDKRFNRPDADWMGVFRAAAEMALMAQVGTDLRPVDRTRLRELWDALLAQ